MSSNRDDVILSVAHDLKHPLSVMHGYIQLLRMELDRGNTVEPVRLDRALGAMERAFTAMARMTDELVQSARPHSDAKPLLRRRTTDLVELVRAAVAAAQVTTPQHCLSLTSGCARLEALVDEDEMQRVLSNLLTNAIKFSPAGGKIRVRLSRGEGAHGAYATLVVRDSGIGILPHDLAHIFEAGYRGTNALQTAPGLGAGLASARRIVELHGGTISATSTPGHGSAFTIRLPLDEPGAA